MRLIVLLALIMTVTACGVGTEEDFGRRIARAREMPAGSPEPATPIAQMRRIPMAMPAGITAEAMTADKFLDWAEATYPQFFPGRGTTAASGTYRFRYYRETDLYLAIENGTRVIALGRLTGNRVVTLGLLRDFDGVLSVLRESIRIEDPSPYYRFACEFPNLSFLIPVRINDDARMDFIAHYWCSQPPPWGLEVTTATPDALVAFVSQPDGRYAVENERVFGARLYGLGGASRKYVRSDINGDGRDDFAFAMNWEDGRSGVDPRTNAARSSVLLSTPGGGYRVTRLGSPHWNHAVEIVRHPDAVDVVFAGFTGPFEVFRYSAGTFVDVWAEYASAQTPLTQWAGSLRAIHDPVTGITERIAGGANRQFVDPSGVQALEPGIQIFGKTSGSWGVLGEFWNRIVFTVGWISWQLTPGTTGVFSANGKQYFGGAVDAMCVMPPLSPGQSRSLVIKVNGARDAASRTLVPGATYREQETLPVNIFRFVEIDVAGGPREIASPVVDEEVSSNFNRFECGDINNDGLPDLVSYAFTRPGFNERVAEGGKPTVYINNGRGQLVRTDISHLPSNTASSELQSVMTDVDGDGIVDLVLFGSTTHGGGGDIRLYLLNSVIRRP